MSSDSKPFGNTAKFVILVVGLALVVGGWIWSRPQSAPVAHAGPGIQFLEVQDDAGVDFHHFNHGRDSLLPEDVGSGLGWVDYDNDGDDDLYLVNFAGPFLMDRDELAKRPGNRLYRNDGNGQFTDVTEESGLGHVGWDYACLWFDYDNDGNQDVAITHYEGVLLYHNRGDGTFEESTAKAKLDGINRFLLGMTAGDYDRDGDLDLYLCGYVVFDREKSFNRPTVSGRAAVWTNPVSRPPLSSILLRNEGDGTFVDVTDEAGVANPGGKTMQALFCDFDDDGWPDLYVANDVATADALFRNLGNGTFEDVSIPAGTYDRRATMGLATGDLWHRGKTDLFTTHWVEEDHAIWKNQSVNLEETGSTIILEDVALDARITKFKSTDDVGWGTGLYDFDNDGHLDLILANGSTIEDELTLEVLDDPKLIPQPSQIIRNTGKGTFEDVSEKAGPFFARELVCRGLACSDFNQDGRLDAALLVYNGRLALLQNATNDAGHWLQIRLKPDPK
ncbi:MAG: hypothetical protein CMJ48_07485, partial [Planctomycetaceae bacterium]|nr:hypothetical protein [Planctomycetaceae bacterium]